MMHSSWKEGSKVEQCLPGDAPKKLVDLWGFVEITQDLLRSAAVQSMAQWKHHGEVSCLDHSLSVAVTSFRLAKKYQLDQVTVARAGLLHDLYLYHKRDKSAHAGLQCIDHPKIAVENAKKITQLSAKEEHCILAHMWPFGGPIPQGKEAWLVNWVDTFSAAGEFSKLCHPASLRGEVYEILSQLSP